MNVNIQSISLNGDAGLFKGQLTVIVQNITILKKTDINIKKLMVTKLQRVQKLMFQKSSYSSRNQIKLLNKVTNNNFKTHNFIFLL
jgi:hypothetical protein